MSQQPVASDSILLPTVAFFAAGLAFIMLLDASFLGAGGHLEYPSSDVYANLAVAENLVGLTYGLNAGEHSSVATSIIYPALLMPFSGDDLHRLVPLAWHAVGLVLAAWFWGRLVARSGVSEGAFGLLLAGVAPIALNMVGAAYLGGEHILHVAAGLAVLLGLLRLIEDERISSTLLAGVLLAPLLRIEGIALIAAVVLLLLVTLRLRAAIIVAAVGLGPATAFIFGLTTLGLDPWSSRVFADIAVAPNEVPNVLALVTNRLALALEPRALIIGFLAALAILLSFAIPVRNCGRWPVLWVVALAAGAHLIFGRFDTPGQSEVYILVLSAAGVAMALPAFGRQSAILLVLAPIAVAALIYPPRLLTQYPDYSHAAQLRGSQIARLVTDHLKVPVATDRLGRLNWQNPYPVIKLRDGDLIGASDPESVDVAILHGSIAVGFAGSEWRELGSLSTELIPLGSEMSEAVAIVVRASADAESVQSAVEGWAADLPEGAEFTISRSVEE